MSIVTYSPSPPDESRFQPLKLSAYVRDILLRYRADLLALAGLASPTPLVGQIITGLVVGRGANYLHDLVSRWGPE